MEQRLYKKDIKEIFESTGKVVGKVSITDNEVIIEQIFEKQAIKKIFESAGSDVEKVEFNEECITLFMNPTNQQKIQPLPSIKLELVK